MLKGLFQLGYVTNDLDRAMAHFKDKYAIREFGIIPSGGNARIALTYVGPTMVELIEAADGAQAIFVDWVKDAEGFVIRHHHLGMLVDSREEMAATRARAIEAGHPVAMEGEVDGFVQYLYVNSTRELGHYLEYIRPDAGAKQLFDSLPRH